MTMREAVFVAVLFGGAALMMAQTPPAPRVNPTENSVNLLGVQSGAVDMAAGRYVTPQGTIVPMTPGTAVPTNPAAAAKARFREMTIAQPRSTEAWTGLARAHNFDGEIAEAITAYERLGSIAPATPNLNSWLAELHIAQNDWAAARRAAEREIAAQPNSGWAHSWLGSVDYETGRFEQAAATFRRAAQIDPQAANFRYQNGTHLATAGHYRRALVDFIAAALMNPNFAGAYFGMADCYARLAMPAAAMRYYERYVQLDGASEWAARARAEIARLRRAN